MPARAAEIAGELVARFEAQGVHEEAAKAMRLFQEAVLTERITAELARSISTTCTWRSTRRWPLRT